jgi:hypothetical protein
MVEPGIDLNITVGTPGGGSTIHFFHLTSAFFGLTSSIRFLIRRNSILCTQHLDALGICGCFTS